MYNLEEISKKKLLIFDMDGTLFDTAEANYWAYHDAADKLGYEIEHDKFMQVFVGRNYKEFLPLFGVNDENDLREIHDYKKEAYKTHIDKIKKNDVLFEVMDKVRNDCKIALATTASKENTNDILEYFGVKDYFDYVLAQEDVAKLKPDPECYIKVMERMKVSPNNTIIFEDSEVGIQAAFASGADWVRVIEFL